MGDWLLRAADGFTGRANSALAAGDPGRPLPEAVEAVRAWYARLGQPAMIAVPFPMAGPAGELDGLLDAGGWSRRDGPAIVMTARPGAIAGLAPGVRGGLGPGAGVGVRSARRGLARDVPLPRAARCRRWPGGC